MEVICALCGETIEKEHPIRLTIQSYKVRSRFSGYAPSKTHHLCEMCEYVLEGMLKYDSKTNLKE